MGDHGPLILRRLLFVVAVIVLGVIVFAMLRLEAGPTATTLAGPTTTMTTSSTSSTTTTTTTTTTMNTTSSTTTTTGAPTTTISSPVFQSSIGMVAAADLPASWREGCPLDVAALRSVDVSHFGYDAVVHTGRLIVAAEVA